LPFPAKGDYDARTARRLTRRGFQIALRRVSCPRSSLVLLTMALDPKTRVLIAEDNPNLRKVIVNIVKKIGFSDIVECEDGATAWEAVEKGGVGLVLTDWAMPTMTGLDLLKRIRASRPPISNVPILMITAADTKDSIMMAGKEGVDAYVIKPFSVKTIMDKIEEAVANRAGK
jgi:two-component system chemotaxis response regulator CheY